MERQAKPTASATGLFQALNFYMIRAPLLPVELYDQLFTNEGDNNQELRDRTLTQLQLLAEDPVIREAIAVASPSLLNALSHLSACDQPRKQDQAVRGFLRYLLRMIARPTPFGLFAGVSSGTFGEQATLTLGELSQHRKLARPDMEWLTKLVLELENDEEIRSKLRISVNTLCERRGSRLELLFMIGRGSAQGQDLSLEKPSIRMTPVVELVMKFAEKPIPFLDLHTKIHQHYSDTPQEKIEEYLLQLFQQEFLVSELRPPLTSTDPFQHVCQVIERLDGATEWKQQLGRLQHLLHEYNRMPIGTGEAMYQKIKTEMKQLVDVKDPLQIDVALATEQTVLPESVREEVTKAAEVLWKLSSAVTGLEFLNSFRSDFLQKYDTYREISLLTLLNTDQGLGAPAGYMHPPSHREFKPSVSFHQLKRDALLMEWVGKAFANGDEEVVLNDQRVAQLTEGEPDLDQAPLSLELFFTLSAMSEVGLDKGEYQLIMSPNAGSDSVGKSFGRFLHLLGDKVYQQMADAQAVEQSMQPDAVFAEVVYYPNVSRNANVAITAHNRPYEILLGVNSTNPTSTVLPLSDLVVGCTMDTLYLKSKSINKRVIPTANHMLNQATTPNIYRFLRDIALESQRNWSKFSWGSLDQMTRLPRLRYGRVVLAPARWKLFGHAEPFRSDMSESEWMDAFRKWRREWCVTRHVLYTHTDNRLLLDLEHPLHLAELRRDFVKLSDGDSLLLLEAEGYEQKQVLRSPKGRHVVECVFPILRTQTRTTLPAPGVHVPLSAGERLHLPGSEWMYVKLYGAESRQEELIGWHIRSFCQSAREEGLAEQSYYLRYADPDFHVRLRFHGAPDRLAGQLLPQLAHWGRNLQQEGLLTRFVVDSYDPEVERYGGPDLMIHVEQLFSADSALVADWLGMKREGQWQLGWEMTAVLSTIDLLQQFGLSRQEQLHFFRAIDHKQYLGEFRKERRMYLALADFECGELQRHPNGHVMLQHFERRAPFVHTYAQALRVHQEQQILTNKWEDVLASVVHLHMNRLLGVDRELEHKIMTLTRHCVQALHLAQQNALVFQ